MALWKMCHSLQTAILICFNKMLYNILKLSTKFVSQLIIKVTSVQSEKVEIDGDRLYF